MTTARRAPGSGRLRAAEHGRRAAGGRFSTVLGDRASVAVALRSRRASAAAAASMAVSSPARESPAGRGSWRRSDRSRSCRRSRGPVPRAGAPGWRSRRRSCPASWSRRAGPRRRSPPRLASIRRSKSSASSTNGAPATSSAPNEAHSPPASPPAAPVIGTPRGSPNAARRRSSRATAAPSAPFCGPNTLAACSNGRPHVAEHGDPGSAEPPAPAIASTAPRPPSVVALPPAATSTWAAPVATAAAISWPVPALEAASASRSSGATSARRSPRQPRRGRSGRRRAAPGRPRPRARAESLAATVRTSPPSGRAEPPSSLAAVGDGSEVRSGQARRSPARGRSPRRPAARSAFP